MTLPLIEIAGQTVCRLGQGTWYMGDRGSDRQSEAKALRAGLDLGLKLIDTAEMYANGGAEEVVGEAIAGRRDEVCLVSKVVPSNASAKGAIAACEASLRRLRTDWLDLYLLHWPGSYPLEETIAAFERLRADGKIRHWGVSNFDAADMAELMRLPGGSACATNQILYNLARRWPEPKLLPESRRLGMPIMAYSPIEQGRLLRQPALRACAERHGVSPAQVALAWLLDKPDVLPIPKAASLAHLQDNHAALSLRLSEADKVLLDGAFPRPKGSDPRIEML